MCQRSDIVLPASVAPSRMKENFELDPAAVEEISALDRGEDSRTGPHPDTFDKVPT